MQGRSTSQRGFSGVGANTSTNAARIGFANTAEDEAPGPPDCPIALTSSGTEPRLNRGGSVNLLERRPDLEEL